MESCSSRIMYDANTNISSPRHKKLFKQVKMSNLVLLTADLKGESEGFVLKETISGCFVFLITPRHSLTLWRGFMTNCDFLKMSNYFWICGKIQTESKNDLCLISSLSYMCFLKQDPMLVQQKRKDFTSLLSSRSYQREFWEMFGHH